MFNTEPISKLVDELPKRSITTLVLGALDFVVPGQYHNHTNFHDFARAVTAEEREGRLQAIANHADQLYAGDMKGCQRAVWLYQSIEGTDRLLGAAGLVHQAGEKIGFLSMLSKITPKPDTAQAIDLAMKLAAEGLATLSMRGLKPEELNKLEDVLHEVSNEQAMRMAALVCLDGILPLGPDFLGKVATALDSAPEKQVQSNGVFQKLTSMLPGGLGLDFVKGAFARSRGWIEGFTAGSGVTREALVDKLKGVMDLADDKLDFVSAFLDATTSPMSHTGTQSAARAVLLKAYARFQPTRR